jgi:hypothetical protein
MAFNLRGVSAVELSNFREKLSRLSRQFESRKSPALRLTVRALLALAVGSWAQSVSGTSALKNWRRKNPPSRELWQAALQTKGYRVVSSTREASQVLLRKLPASFIQEDALAGTLWISTHTREVAWVQSGSPPVLAVGLLQRRPGKSPRKNQWVEAGEGWDALESWLKRPTENAPVSAKKKWDRRDPKEWTY